MLFLLSLFFLSHAATPSWDKLHSHQGWKHDKTVKTTVGDVEIYIKNIDGFPCFLGSSLVQGLEKELLLKVATDIPSHSRWSSAGLIESEILSSTDKHLDYYQHLDLPFVSDRFWFLRGFVQRSGRETIFRWDRLIDGGPHKKRHKAVLAKHPGAVEPPVNIGGWSFVSKDAALLVRYYICTNPGGSVPRSFQQIGTARTLPNNIRDLIVEGKKRAK